jgi:hypothetical protein
MNPGPTRVFPAVVTAHSSAPSITSIVSATLRRFNAKKCRYRCFASLTRKIVNGSLKRKLVKGGDAIDRR